MGRASPAILEDIFGFVGFGEADARALEALGPLLEPNFDSVVGSFYDAVLDHPRAFAVLSGPEQVERLRRTLRRWLEGVFAGEYGVAYFEERARIGRVHVQIELEQHFMFGAMNIIRRRLHGEVRKLEMPAVARGEAHEALDKILDVELAIMLETYREAFVRRMRQAERLATLGQLAASIGHELRNPLAVVETSLHLLKRRVPEDDRVRRHLHRIGDQVARCGQIISDLLELARDSEPGRIPTDLSASIRKVVSELPDRGAVTIELDLPSDLPDAWVDAGQFRQLITNLALNALQAVEDRESARISIALRRLEQGCELSVEDTGPGLRPEVLLRLFEPLFTTRARGIGLGLSLCKRIVEKHGGQIEASNREAGGARFEVRLPGVFPAAPEADVAQGSGSQCES